MECPSQWSVKPDGGLDHTIVGCWGESHPLKFWDGILCQERQKIIGFGATCPADCILQDKLNIYLLRSHDWMGSMRLPWWDSRKGREGKLIMEDSSEAMWHCICGFYLVSLLVVPVKGTLVCCALATLYSYRGATVGSLLGDWDGGGAPGVSTILRRCCIIDTKGLDTLESRKGFSRHAEFTSMYLLFYANWSSWWLLVLKLEVSQELLGI